MRDELFIRGDVPMTKSEVRAVSISKLELEPDSVLYDIGAGTGSVSIEASRYLTEGRVYAIEKKAEAIDLIKANRERFGVSRLEIVEGAAPEALAALEVLSLVLKKNPGVRIVINAIALESVAEILSWLKQHSVTAEIVQVSISRGREAGDYHLMMGQIPVYVVSFGGEGRNGLD